jgi:Holliday junction resolvasome RuvABC ATP-dependent DNA helicase subunit
MENQENDNLNIVSKTRPISIDEVIGLDHIKHSIRYEIEGSIKLNQPIPSFIISGPGGTGKSTVANIIAALSGGNVEKFLGGDIKRPEDLFDLAQRLQNGDVVVIEEAHTLNSKCQAVLLEWIENFKILGGGEYGILHPPKVSFILPTTDEGQLSKPFRTRCRILNTHYYRIDEIAKILTKSGTKLGLDLSSDPQALQLLATSSRATPRIAIMHRLDMLRKVMVVDNLPYNHKTVMHMLRSHNIHPWGLEHNDIKYCKVLYKKLQDNNGKPVARKILVQATGLAENVIDNVIEAYLQQINVIKVESKGRIITNQGFDILGFEPIKIDIDSLRAPVNMDLLKELVKDEKLRKQGIKGLAPKLGLMYGKDNAIIQDALYNIGLISRKNVGIEELDELDYK